MPTAPKKRQHLLSCLLFHVVGHILRARPAQAHKLACGHEVFVNTSGRLCRRAPGPAWAWLDSEWGCEHQLPCIVSLPQAVQQRLPRTRSARCSREGSDNWREESGGERVTSWQTKGSAACTASDPLFSWNKFGVMSFVCF